MNRLPAKRPPPHPRDETAPGIDRRACAVASVTINPVAGHDGDDSIVPDLGGRDGCVAVRDEHIARAIHRHAFGVVQCGIRGRAAVPGLMGGADPRPRKDDDAGKVRPVELPLVGESVQFLDTAALNDASPPTATDSLVGCNVMMGAFWAQAPRPMESTPAAGRTAFRPLPSLTNGANTPKNL